MYKTNIQTFLDS